MAQKQKIAIIGVNTLGTTLARELANDYNLLLVGDERSEEMQKLQNDLRLQFSVGECELLDCSKDASWQADLIILAIDAEKQLNVAHKIKEVATCKTVICFSSSSEGQEGLAPILPHSKLVNIRLSSGTANGIPVGTIIEYDVSQAVQAAIDIIKEENVPCKSQVPLHEN